MKATPEQQRIIVAEWMPKKFVIMKRGLYYRPNACGYTDNPNEAWIVDEATADKHTYPHDEPVTKHPAPTPDYPNDLNACNIAEEKLTPVQRVVYGEMLCSIVLGENGIVDWGYYPGESEIDWDNVSQIVHATAAQRTEALCRIIKPKAFE